MAQARFDMVDGAVRDWEFAAFGVSLTDDTALASDSASLTASGVTGSEFVSVLRCVMWQINQRSASYSGLIGPTSPAPDPDAPKIR